MTKRSIKAVTTLMGAAALSGAMLAATPAMAQKRDQKAASKEVGVPAPSKGFMATAQAAQKALDAKDFATLGAVLDQGRALATEPQDRYWLGYFDLQRSLGISDKALQARALDMVLDSGLTPAAQLGVFTAISGKMAYTAKDYAKAIKRFEAVQALGHQDPEVPALLINTYYLADRTEDGLAAARRMIAADRAAGRVTPEIVYSNSAAALQQANRTAELNDVLVDWLSAYPTRDNWNRSLRIVLRQLPDDRDMLLDTYRLMAATKSFKERNEYLEYALASADRGLPGEVVGTVETARASGLVTASDPAFNEVYTSRKTRVSEDRASLTAAARDARAGAQARIAVSTGDAMMSYGDYSGAAALYEAALTKAGADADLIQTRIGIARALGGDKVAARTAFSKVGGARAPIARMWMVHLADGPAAAAAPSS